MSMHDPSWTIPRFLTGMSRSEPERVPADHRGLLAIGLYGNRD